MKFKIRREDIKDGVPEHMSWCPIGLSIEREFGHQFEDFSKYDEFNVEVDWDHAVVTLADKDGETLELSAMLPTNAMEFIAKFDEGETVRPCTININFRGVSDV